MQKQIPTFLGLGVLVIALGAGIFFLGDGPGIFAPRASPQTTPKNIRVSNVSDTSFTVSFLTDETTAGFIKYGEEEGSLKSQASDDRDQLSGSVGKFSTHHVTVRGLQPGTPYFYTLGTGSNSSFDNNGSPFKLTTAKKAGAPSAAKTIYGTVNTAGGTPAEGSMVYVVIPGVGDMSALVKSSGSWAVPLSNARTTDGSAYAQINDTDTATLTVQGPAAADTTSTSVTIAQAQPVATLVLGQGGVVAAPQETPAVLPTGTASESSGLLSTLPSPSASASPSPSASASAAPVGGSLTNLLSQTTSSSTSSAQSSSATSTSSARTASSSAQVTVLDLTKTGQQTVTTQQPVITGQAAPGVKIKISVHSDTQIEQELIADGKGGFTLDISKLANDPRLEPGEHTVTYSYVDPTTGKEVTKTQTFMVKPATTAAAASASPKASAKASASPSASPALGGVPYGSGNPFPASSSASPKATATSSSTRTSLPATTSGIPTSGTVSTTLALIMGGMFFIGAGLWSFWVAQELEA